MVRHLCNEAERPLINMLWCTFTTNSAELYACSFCRLMCPLWGVCPLVIHPKLHFIVLMQWKTQERITPPTFELSDPRWHLQLVGGERFISTVTFTPTQQLHEVCDVFCQSAFRSKVFKVDRSLMDSFHNPCLKGNMRHITCAVLCPISICLHSSRVIRQYDFQFPLHDINL